MTEKWYFPNDDISPCKKVREIVFINEQKVPVEEEYDEFDSSAVHLAYFDNDKPIATCRLIKLNENTYKIGRIAVLKEYRKQGVGKQAVNSMISYAQKQGAKKIEIGAQLQAVGFYEKLGFKTIGSEYMEANIPHICMEKIL